MRNTFRLAAIVSVGALLIFFASALPGQEIAPCRAFLSNGSAFDAVRCIAIPVTPPVDTIVTPPIDTIITPPADTAVWSRAMFAWAGPKYPTECSKEVHNRHSAVGPDGKRYPIFHSPADPSGCHFGHDHGDDPSLSSLASHGPVLFGYVNEQLLAQDSLLPRHEDHVGHKIFSFEDLVFIPKGLHGPADTLSCSILTKLHQGTHSPDALTNNQHEMMVRQSCSDGTFFDVQLLVQNGPAGQMTRGCTPQEKFEVGPAVPEDSPRVPNPKNAGRSMGNRFIPDVLCAVRERPGYLESWKTQNTIDGPDGTAAVQWAYYWFVQNPSRYLDLTKPNKSAYTVDSCWLTAAGQFRVKYGPCRDHRTEAAGVPIPWDDPRSPFNGAQRSIHFDGFSLKHEAAPNRPTVFYTNARGMQASMTPFPGSLKQVVSNTHHTPNSYSRPGALGRDFRAPGVRAPN